MKRLQEEFSLKDIWFEKVMDEYGDKLTKFAYHYLKDWKLAEDVVQDVFVTCYMNFEHRHEITYLKSWLYKITINKCKDYLKSSYVKRTLLDSSLFRLFSSEEPTPEMSVIYQSEDELLSSSVLSLPVKYREVVILFYYEDLSIEEISELLHLNKNTIKTRLNRGRARLKGILERSDVENGRKSKRLT
ncbi:sigma-70 family RNA polymerase sigma factor [Mangrovibacillus cuniculi]|uniref:Sigma-70 family RNA polymerase sigma factor n=1 Tax=Mangrovibacillus cuniculi TaxID=2593652 RepID=A0A7S8HGX7_9BACI|nr:sigma-70 family RNA polymerase sigma factor [Mangrovibacillus cuniculi]QPC48262.1 sigma-70 family RNA polymerase sigma factor [Mangrovibacillus cuniculi]